MITEQTSSKALNGKIRLVRNSYGKAGTYVQDAIVAIIAHARDYNDCTGAARLVDAMPKSARRSLVIDHFADYSPIRVVKDAKTGLMKASLRKPEDGLYKAFDVQGVAANRWDERAGVEKEPDIFDFTNAREMFYKMLKSAEKRAEKSTDKDAILAMVSSIRSAIPVVANENDEQGVAA